MNQPALFPDIPEGFVSDGRFRLSPKQQHIMEIITSEGSITLKRAEQEIGRNIYHNRAKYVGLTLSRMVKRGILRRIKPGVFALEGRLQ